MKVAKRLFAIFSSTYGAKFTDLWKDSDLDEVINWWAANLSDMSDEELRTGLNAILNGKPFPPTLPEFRTACRPPIRVPHVDDHRGLTELARELELNTNGCPSYAALRSMIVRAVDRRSYGATLLGGPVVPMIEDMSGE